MAGGKISGAIACSIIGAAFASEVSTFQHLSMMSKLFGYILAAIGAAAIAVLIIRKVPRAMCLGAVLIHIAATAGLVFSYIQKTPSGGFDPQTRQFTYFSKNARHQYFLEGILMASCVSSTGVSLFFAVKSLSFKPLQKKGLSLPVAIGFFFLAFWLFSFVLQTYQWKTGWYNPTFFPQATAKQGALHHDRGNTF